jgi:hypothetical protein
MNPPVITGHQAEFTWTQPLGSYTANDGSLTFTLEVKAQSSRSPVLYGTCTPAVNIFNPSTGK